MSRQNEESGFNLGRVVGAMVGIAAGVGAAAYAISSLTSAFKEEEPVTTNGREMKSTERPVTFEGPGKLLEGIPGPSTMVTWQPPEMGWIKINVDGSSPGNPGPAGIGGLFRDHNAKWLLGFSVHIGFETAPFAELWAMRYALSLAWEKGYRKIELESDSDEVIQAIKPGSREKGNYPDLVREIKALLAQQWSCLPKHTLREGNYCADFLAKKGAQQQEREIIYESPPPDIRRWLDADSDGVAYPRK